MPEPLGDGYWGIEVEGLDPGTRYGYRLEGGSVLPDPASRSQPEGVHGLSELVRPPEPGGKDRAWRGIAPDRQILYELHVGTFGRPGTFDGVARHLPYLARLGVNALELMPVAQFPGGRNWGYDGVFPFAVQNTYGGIEGLRRLAEACHASGFALLLDVVYNHVGPEGNNLGEFGPYFSDRNHTPWGPAVNLDGAGSDEVRRFFLESAAWLLRTGRLDGLRVDAVHAIVDPTARPFLSELTGTVRAVGREGTFPRYTIAESALNDPRVVRPVGHGGWGFDAMWNDDFHHALHVALTGERQRYFEDFEGTADVRRVLTDAFALAGRYSKYRGRRHGRPVGSLSAASFVVYDQNHDQVGNRPLGERLARLVPFEARKLAAGLLLLSPYVPMLFMGEEYGETRPFLYFTSHGDRRVVRAVRAGRREEFAAGTGGRAVPDPQDPATFSRSILRASIPRGGRARALFELYRALVRLRHRYVPTERLRPAEVGGDPDDPMTLWIHRGARFTTPSFAVFRVGKTPGKFLPPPVPEPLVLRIDSSARSWGGPGGGSPGAIAPGRPRPIPLRPWSFLLYTRRTSG